ncbi:MAG: response regulator transcription factor [Anaerolineales bacterium]|nr:response regulator transcription factor [Anaerolineales bacterium]
MSNNTPSQPTPDPIRVLLADRHTLLRAGLRLLIDPQPNMQVVGEAGSCSQAVELAEKLQPDIILLELNLDGPIDRPETDIISDLLEVAPQARLILVTAIEDACVHQEAVRQGVIGIILKEQPGHILLKAIEKVHAGEVWIDRAMMANVLEAITRARMGIEENPEAVRIDLLSDREREVIALIGKGLKNKQIAERLFISEITVRHHLTSVYSKLGVNDRLELTIFAYRNGLAELPK